MNILSLDHVLKTYDKHTAVDNVSFDMPKGCVFGMLGPNGAGKTSLIRIITTITRADSGTVLFNGEPLNETHPSKIGYMPEERGLYKKMKVGNHLMYLAQLKGLSKSHALSEINQWFEKFGIESWWDKKVEELSKGMQQKIQFISTVVHKPELLILDEPFSGLDPINTNLIKDEIDELHRNGTSIIFSTHRMEQVEEVCDFMVLINQGKNVLQGSVKAVKNQYKENLFKINFEGTFPKDALNQVSVISQKNNSITIQLQEGENSNTLLRHLIQQNVHINSFNEILPTLNEIFIKKVASSNLQNASASL